MTSISEDQTLPLDLDGTSNQLSNSSHFGGGSLQDLSSSSLSELEPPPGTFTNLTSAGRLSPHRTRTMKDQESQLAELKKENFGLKLRIYHLEEALRSKWGTHSEGWQLNIELQVQLDGTKKELAAKDALIMKAKQAIDCMKEEHRAQVHELQQKLANAPKEEELAAAEEEARAAGRRAEELAALCGQQEEALRDKDGELEQLKREVDGLQSALADSAARAPPPTPPLRNAAAQTSEPLADKLVELGAAQARLAEAEEEAAGLREGLADRERRIKELQLELLSSSQSMAADANSHGQQMREEQEQLNKCKARLHEAEEEARRQGAELEQMGRDLEGARQRAREAESLAQRLQPLVQQRDREIQELREQLADAEEGANDDIAGRDREIRELKRRLREAESRGGQADSELAARDREIERLEEGLRAAEEEAARLRSRLREREEALALARKATHTSSMDKQEQAEALDRLQQELAELREGVRRQQAGVQRDLEAALAAKDAIIGQLRRDLQEMQARLDDADEKLLQMTTGKAAELGVLRANIEELTRQLEHRDKLVRELRGAVGQLEGEKASLRQELDRLLAENQELQAKLADLERELAAKSKALQQAEDAVASLRRLLAELQQTQPETEAELTQLQARVAALEAALKTSQDDCEGLRKSVALKDNTIKELRQQVSRLLADKAALEERIRQLEREKGELESEVAGLQSQARIARLAADDLQQKLTQAFSERQELARKLRVAEEALRDKRSAFDSVQTMCDGLQEQVKLLQQQVADLQSSSPGHVTVTRHETSTTEQPATPPKPPTGGGGSNSTTMIFGSLSENLLLQILQQMQELSKEISAGRAEGSMASSSLSAKMERLAALQRHVEDALRSGKGGEGGKAHVDKPVPGNTSYTTYYFMRGEEGEEEEDGGRLSDSSTPKPEPATPPVESSPPAARRDVRAALRDAMSQIRALQAELEEMRRREGGGGGGRDKSSGTPLAASEQFMYRELEKEVDRLLAELEAERQRSQADKEQQQHDFSTLQAQLKEAEEKVDDLERQLREAMMRDASTSTGPELLQQEIERLTNELDEALAAMADLRAELSEARAITLRQTPEKVDKTTLACSSMPNLLTPETPYKSMSDSWTSPPKVSPGDQPDVRALREKHEEVKRLNIELQRKCHEQLKRSPASSRPTSAGHSSTVWQSRLSEQEQALRSEMLEKERSLLAQLHGCEARLMEKEAGWRASEADLRRQVSELESRLGESSRGADNLRSKLAESLANCRSKDEEIRNLTQSLAMARERIQALEMQLNQLLSEKNTRIHELESSVHRLEQELHQLRSQTRGGGGGGEGRRRWHSEEDLLDGGGVAGGGAELQTLQETVDSLTEQLTAALEELEELQNQNGGLEEQKAVLTSQLASCREQVRTLQSELALYQKLLEDSNSFKVGGASTEGAGSPTSGGTQLNLTADRVLELLGEVRRLREELDQSIRSNHALSERLRSKLQQHGSSGAASESHLHYSTHTSPPPPSKGKGSQTEPKKYKHASTNFSATTEHISTHSGTQTDGAKPRHRTSQGTSPHSSTRGEKATRKRSPPSSANKATGTATATLTLHTERSSYYHSGSSSPLSDTNPTASTSTQTAKAKVKPKSTSTMPYTATHVTSPSPRTTSTPRVHKTQRNNGHSSTINSHHTSRVFSDSLHQGERLSRTSRVSRGINTERSRSDDESLSAAAKGPTLDSASSSSFHSFSSSLSRSREEDPLHARPSPATASGGGGGGGGVDRRDVGTSFRPPLVPLLLAQGSGDFSALELKLKQALDSPGLQAADRGFLEELLVYLRQQRRQLDDSQRLLDRLERQGRDLLDGGGVGDGAPLMTESGTTPVAGASGGSFVSAAVYEGGDSFGHVGPTRHIGVPPSNEDIFRDGTFSSGHHRKQTRDAAVDASTGSNGRPGFGGTNAASQTSRSTHRASKSTGTSHSNGGLGSRVGAGVGPTTITTRQQQAAVGGGVVTQTVTAGPSRAQGAKVNLSALYEQLLQTQASLVEARSSLNQQRSH